MNLKEIKEMIELMKENDITELELERDGMKVVLKRGKGSEKEILGATIAVAPAMTPQSAGHETSVPTLVVSEKIHFIKSPMVGTFYRSASPEADPFISKGQMISGQDTVCIIEAMKVMNEIKAEIKGKVVEILVENGEPVEFGQPLFKVEKT